MFNLLKQGKISQGLFAFYLGINGPGELTIGRTQRKHTHSHCRSASTRVVLTFLLCCCLVVGGVDPGYFSGDLHYVPLKNASYWAVPLDGVTVRPRHSTSSHRHWGAEG